MSDDVLAFQQVADTMWVGSRGLDVRGASAEPGIDARSLSELRSLPGHRYGRRRGPRYELGAFSVAAADTPDQSPLS